MSKSAYDMLPEDIRTALSEAGKESADWQRQYVDDQEKPLLDALVEKGVTLTQPDPAPFQEAAVPLYNAMLETDSQQALFDAVMDSSTE